MKQLADIKVTDDATMRALQELRDAVRELQKPQYQVIRDVQLPDSTAVVIAHSLGRKLTTVVYSAPRGATTNGRIVQMIEPGDKSKQFQLAAQGYGATITIDVVVF